jgi:heptosyltransferase II
METAGHEKKFLVIQTASIGDVILATAVVETLHRHFPDAHIGLVVKKGCDALLSGHPWLSALYVWDKAPSKYRNLKALISRIRRGRYDYVINLHRFASSGLIAAFSKATVKIGFDKNPFSFLYDVRVPHKIGIDKNVHETQRNHLLLKSVTDGEAAHPKLYPSAEDFASVEQYKAKPYITIAPVSLWFTKQYPPEKWAELIQNISGRLNVYLLGSKADKQVNEKIRERCAHPVHVINFAGGLTLLQTAALIRDARMNFSNDSAALHIASAMNAPVTAVFCSTVPEFGFGPLSE